MSVIEDFVDNNKKPLPFQTAALAALNPALKAAQKEWAEADQADAAYQKLLKNVRDTAAVFDPELQAFRRTVPAVFGRNDKDFQKLRAERAAQADAEDDPGAPKPPAPVVPADAPPEGSSKS